MEINSIEELKVFGDDYMQKLCSAREKAFNEAVESHLKDSRIRLLDLIKKFNLKFPHLSFLNLEMILPDKKDFKVSFDGDFSSRVRNVNCPDAHVVFVINDQAFVVHKGYRESWKYSFSKVIPVLGSGNLRYESAGFFLFDIDVNNEKMVKSQLLSLYQYLKASGSFTCSQELEVC